MAVYKPREGSATWWTKFRHEGHLIRRDTGAADRRDAQRVEDRLKAEVKAAQLGGKRARVITEEVRSLTTFGAAVEEYIESVVGQHGSESHRTNTLWSLAWLVREIGESARLDTIADLLVGKLVARRRGEKGRHGQELSKATVNRSVTEPLRKVLRRAARINRLALPIDWNLHLLDEPEEVVRELQAGEEARLFDETVMRSDFAPAVQVALLLGLRAGEIRRMTWADVDFGNRRIKVQAKRKTRFVPIIPEVREILFPLQGHHSRFVFTYEVRRTRDGRTAGERLPLSETGFNTIWRRLRARAGIEAFRFHDTRHTAATRVMRQSKNPKTVQKLLGHANIETTMRYAHVYDDDVFEAVALAAAQSGQQSGQQAGANEVKAEALQEVG